MRVESNEVAARWAVSAITVLGATLIAAQRMAGETWQSDDVAWQVAFRTWRPGGSVLYVTDNTYVVHWPLLVGADAVLPDRPLQLFVVSVVLNAVGLYLTLRFVRKVISVARGDRPLTIAGDVVAAAVVLSLLVSSFVVRQAHAGPTSRGLEIGLYLAAIQYGVEVWRGERTVVSWLGLGSVAAVVGVLSLNDPLFTLSIVLPGIVVFLVGAWRTRRRDLLMLAGGALAGLALWQLMRGALWFVGIRQVSSGAEFDPGGAGGRLSVLGRVLVSGLGLDGPDSLSTASYALQFVVGTVLVAGVGLGLVVGVRSRSFPLEVLAALAWLAVLCVLFVVSTSASLATGRYVYIGLAGLAPLAAIGLCRLPRTAWVGAALAAAAVGSAAVDVADRYTGDEAADQLVVTRRVEELVAAGYRNVVGGYWSAAITSFYGDDLHIVPVRCAGDGTVPYRWLMDFGVVEDAIDGSGGTIVITEPTPPGVCAGFQGQLGTPERHEKNLGDSELWVYDTNVVPLLGDTARD